MLDTLERIHVDEVRILDFEADVLALVGVRLALAIWSMLGDQHVQQHPRRRDLHRVDDQGERHERPAALGLEEVVFPLDERPRGRHELTPNGRTNDVNQRLEL